MQKALVPSKGFILQRIKYKWVNIVKWPCHMKLLDSHLQSSVCSDEHSLAFDCRAINYYLPRTLFIPIFTRFWNTFLERKLCCTKIQGFCFLLTGKETAEAEIPSSSTFHLFLSPGVERISSEQIIKKQLEGQVGNRPYDVFGAQTAVL